MSRYAVVDVQKSYRPKSAAARPSNSGRMTVHAASETDVTFGSSEHGPLVATLYRPAGTAVAAVVDVHGGAWTSGDRTMNVAISRYLAAHGIAVLALDFRMPPLVAYPTTVTDIAAGIRWLKQHADELGTVAMRVGMLGTSSGGHLALLAALRPSDPRYAGSVQAGEPDIAVPFAVVCWPVSDPAARYRMVRDTGLSKLAYAHHAFWADEAQMTEGSPLDIVARGDAERLPSLLIVQGTNDENLTPDMQDRFAAAYRARGGSIELAVFDGEPHGFIARDPASVASRTALERIVAFIRRVVGG
jgi:acetyl esterase/lipase